MRKPKLDKTDKIEPLHTQSYQELLELAADVQTEIIQRRLRQRQPSATVDTELRAEADRLADLEPPTGASTD